MLPASEERVRPTELVVGPRTYTIHWDAETWHEKAERADGAGEANHKTQDILIAPGFAPQAMADTLWHEVLHCCLSMAGDVRNYKDHEDLEEHLVTALTPWMLMVLLDNPEILQYISDPF